MLVLSGLPEPRLNVPLGDEHDFVARPDLVYLDQHVAVEYDGEHHWRDRRQPSMTSTDERRSRVAAGE